MDYWRLQEFTSRDTSEKCFTSMADIYSANITEKAKIAMETTGSEKASKIYVLPSWDM